MGMSRTEEEAAAAAIAERLNDPLVAQSLASLLDHVELLSILVGGLDQLVSRSEVISQSMVEGVDDLRAMAAGNPGDAPVDFGAVVSAGRQLAGVLPKAAPGMVHAVESGAIDTLLGSDLVSTEAVDQISLLARGLVKGGDRFAAQPVQIGGLLALGKLLKDPDINRALSYFATVAKSVGQELAASSSTSHKS